MLCRTPLNSFTEMGLGHSIIALTLLGFIGNVGIIGIPAIYTQSWLSSIDDKSLFIIDFSLESVVMCMVEGVRFSMKKCTSHSDFGETPILFLSEWVSPLIGDPSSTDLLGLYPRILSRLRVKLWDSQSKVRRCSSETKGRESLTASAEARSVTE